MSKLAIALICIFFAACSTSKNTASQSNSAATTSNATTTIATSTPELNSVSSNSVDTTNAEENATARGTKVKADLQAKASSIYFDYDQFEIKPEFRKILEQEVGFLKAHPNAVITIEGNADERGSTDFNLALGDKRASSVQKSLELMGASEKQLKVVSYGETKPKMVCHEEKCWHENRRVDFSPKS